MKRSSYPLTSAPRVVARAVLLLACSLLLACGTQSGSSSAPQPNVILIISDDHSWPYFGFMGSPIVETPNLDRIAEEGVVFTHGFSTASVCRPALASLLTGLHPIQWEMRNQQLERQGVPRRPTLEIEHFNTLPKMLGAVGYRSFQGGKYWESTHAAGGFDFGVKGTKPGSDASAMRAFAGGDGLDLGRQTLEPLFDFIDQRGEQPFFVWYAPYLPHKPHNPPQKYKDLYAEHKLHPQALDYYANISWLDAGVGQIVDYLDRNDLRDDTLILFLSDNGYEQPPTKAVGFQGGNRGKASIYDYGFRTPIIANWPGHTPSGVRDEALLSAVDVFSTIADYAGAEVPLDREGRSFRPFLEGGEPPGRKRIVTGNTDIARLPPYVIAKRPALGERQKAYAVRTHRWHYIWYMDADVQELYDVLRDPGETRNVAGRRPQLAATFKAEIQPWLDVMSAPYAAN